jgi:hypothetical protein
LLEIIGMRKGVGTTPLSDDIIVASQEYANQARPSTLRGGGGIIGDKRGIAANMRRSGTSSGKRLYSSVSFGHIYTDLIGGVPDIYQGHRCCMWKLADAILLFHHPVYRYSKTEL